MAIRQSWSIGLLTFSADGEEVGRTILRQRFGNYHDAQRWFQTKYADAGYRFLEQTTGTTGLPLIILEVPRKSNRSKLERAYIYRKF